MTDDDQDISVDAEAEKFLARDFTECFAQMRHYDTQIWNICKFAVTAYTALIGIAIGFYQYTLEKGTNLIPMAVAALAVALAFGLFMFFLVIRNRVYFVLVTRYINEHRGFFLARRPFGFPNVARMYTNPNQPPYFNWRSSQSFFVYLIEAMNSFLAATLVFLSCQQWNWAIAASAAAFLAQLVAGIVYLKSRESKTASQAVFGKD